MDGVSLGGTKEVFHIEIYVLEAVSRGCHAVSGIVRPRRGGVDHEGGAGVQGVDVCVIGNRLVCCTEEVS